MGRPRKLSTKQVKNAAKDRRNGMSWNQLKDKYKCAVNKLRSASLIIPMSLTRSALCKDQNSKKHSKKYNPISTKYNPI